MNKAAFFDIDGTLFRNSLLIEHFKLLIKYSYISESVWVNNIKDKYEKWSKRTGDFEEYLEDLVDLYVDGIKDIDLESIDFVAKRVIDIKSDKMYTYTKNKMLEHLKDGYKVIVISGSPEFLVKKMAEKYNLTDYKGTEYIIENGKFNGDKIPMWDSESKSKAIDYFVKKYDIDLENSYSYGDTTGDLSMFEKVGNPIAINPAARLLDKLKDRKDILDKIKVVIERKNVIYKVDGNKLKDLDIEYVNREGK